MPLNLRRARRPASEVSQFGAIAPHHTAVDKDGAWDAGANLKRLGDTPTKAQLRALHAWVDPDKDAETKAAYKLPHHDVSDDGKVGAANMKAVESAMGRLNGGGLDIPKADREGVHAHLAAHYKDAGMDAPELKASAERGDELHAVSGLKGEARMSYLRRGLNLAADDGVDDSSEDEEEKENGVASFVPATANEKDGSVDCVWYGGATVPRYDYDTGDPYMLKLSMDGCRMDRLNAGSPVFDTHFTGDDFKSLMAGKSGTKAQLGVVRKAWSDGDKGLATLQFDMGSPDGAEMFRKVAAGQVQNISFGAWIYKREKTEAMALPEGKAPYSNPDEIGTFTATDWEPFEISPCTVPADFSTQFLSAQTPPKSTTGVQPKKEEPVENKQATTGAEARTEVTFTQEQLSAAEATARQEAQKLEAARQTEIRKIVKLSALDETFGQKLIDDFVNIEEARKAVFQEIERKGKLDANGQEHTTHAEISITREKRDTVRECMEAALLVRYDGNAYKDLREKGREYAGLSLMEMAKESLSASGVKVRGMDRLTIAKVALYGRNGASEYFAGGAESTSDFPSILANVANKTLRQAYEAFPRTFQPFSRQVTATDFKPINRVQLSDAPTLQKLNEKGEYHRANLKDSNQSYSLATFGEIVAITRKVIINDDLQAFTRVPALLGVAAAQLESDTVWAVLTGNPVMGEDGVALFNSAHSNDFTGSGSALSLGAATPATGMTQARMKMRQQVGPNGTHLNLIPRFVAVPTTLETVLLQMIAPMNIASPDVTKVVPEWVRSIIPIVEPRLDVASTTGWYVIADPAQIDTVEYAYLEGQQGVYIETRQGFEVDGVEIKARMDFAAAAIDYRGLQFNAGA